MIPVKKTNADKHSLLKDLIINSEERIRRLNRQEADEEVKQRRRKDFIESPLSIESMMLLKGRQH